MLSATEVRKGMIVKYEGELQYVMNVFHHTPGNLRSVIQIKMRNLRSGTSKEIRFSSGDKLEQAHVEQVDMEFLYQDGDSFVFMNQENYEQVSLHRELLGEDDGGAGSGGGDGGARTGRARPDDDDISPAEERQALDDVGLEVRRRAHRDPRVIGRFVPVEPSAALPAPGASSVSGALRARSPPGRRSPRGRSAR